MCNSIPPNRHVVTIGVSAFIDEYGIKGYWLIATIATIGINVESVRKEDYQVWELTTDNSRGLSVLTATNRHDTVLAKREYKRIDEISHAKFYVADNGEGAWVIMLPEED